MHIRLIALLALTLCSVSAQSEVPVPPLLQADESDPIVVRARDDLEQTRKLVMMGSIPLLRLRKAQDEVQDALDMSLLKKSLFSKDLAVEQMDQMVYVAEKMVYRRQRAMAEIEELVNSGVVSPQEAGATPVDLQRAQKELEVSRARAKLIEQLAETARIDRAFAGIETEAEFHPEWNGKVYLKYDGSGVFNRTDLAAIETAFVSKFLKPLPISADGETATHRAMKFNHKGRVDVAVSPDQPEGTWLMKFLEDKHIPYFAFRIAVPGKATGAHIHLGPQSTQLAF